MAVAVATLAARSAVPVAAQEWMPFAAPIESLPHHAAPRSAPLTGWTVSITRTPPVAADHAAAKIVAAADPAWTARVTFSRAPLLVANPIPRATPRPTSPLTGRSHILEGTASFYWQDQMTATGERFDRTALTAAHRTLPLNCRVRVTNVVNGRSVVVRINDRGPYKPGRIIDLSEAAAQKLDMERIGLVPVKLDVISY